MRFWETRVSPHFLGNFLSLRRVVFEHPSPRIPGKFAKIEEELAAQQVSAEGEEGVCAMRAATGADGGGLACMQLG